MASAQPANPAPVRKDEVNVRRMAKVVLALAAAMAVGLAVCWVFPAEPPMADRTVFPGRMAELRPWRQIVVHRTAAPDRSFESVAGGSAADGAGATMPVVHFVVGGGRALGDGEVRHTRLWLEQLPAGSCPADGAVGRSRDEAAAQRSEPAIAVALVGNFRTQPPTAAQMDSLVALVHELTSRLRIPLTGVLLHSDLSGVDCPGAEFPTGDFFRRLGERYR